MRKQILVGAVTLALAAAASPRRAAAMAVEFPAVSPHAGTLPPDPEIYVSDPYGDLASWPPLLLRDGAPVPYQVEVVWATRFSRLLRLHVHVDTPGPLTLIFREDPESSTLATYHYVVDPAWRPAPPRLIETHEVSYSWTCGNGASDVLRFRGNPAAFRVEWTTPGGHHATWALARGPSDCWVFGDDVWSCHPRLLDGVVDADLEERDLLRFEQVVRIVPVFADGSEAPALWYQLVRPPRIPRDRAAIAKGWLSCSILFGCHETDAVVEAAEEDRDGRPWPPPTQARAGWPYALGGAALGALGALAVVALARRRRRVAVP